MTKEKTNLLIINRLRSKGYDTDNMDFTIVNDFVDIIYKEQLILSGVVGRSEQLFCGGCGRKRELKRYSDLNSGRSCINKLCKEK